MRGGGKRGGQKSQVGYGVWRGRKLEGGDDGESGKTERSAERWTVWRSARRRRLIRGTVGRAAANQSRAGRPGACMASELAMQPPSTSGMQ